jgi:hypothetical protein
MTCQSRADLISPQSLREGNTMAPPGEQVRTYGFLVYGSQSGYQNARAQIELNGTSQTVGFIRFCDPGVTFPTDTFNNGIVTMYLPTSMFEPMLNILRTEKIVSVYFTLGRGFLYTGNRTVGG